MGTSPATRGMHTTGLYHHNVSLAAMLFPLYSIHFTFLYHPIFMSIPITLPTHAQSRGHVSYIKVD